jgi:hypothetical protein
MIRILYFTFVLLTLSTTAFAGDIEVVNLNSYFEDDLQNWQLVLSNAAEAEAIIDDSDSIKGSQCVYIDIKKLGTGSGFWEIRFAQLSVTGNQGDQYTISVWAKADGGPRQIRPHWRFATVNAQTFDITDEWAEYSFTFVANGTTADLDIALGATMGNLWLDNFRLYEGPYEEDPDLGRIEEKIAVDSVGKLAVTWAKVKTQ